MPYPLPPINNHNEPDPKTLGIIPPFFSPWVMIFGAGYGKRLKPLTDSIPKPLIPVYGQQSCLSMMLDYLINRGVNNIIINCHHLAPQMIEFINSYQQKKQNQRGSHVTPQIRISYEKTLLETGGGIKKVIDLFENSPFLAINGDAVWQDRPTSSITISKEETAKNHPSCFFSKLIDGFDEKSMDILLGIIPQRLAIGYKGPGDYAIEVTALNSHKKDENESLFPLSRTALPFITPHRLIHRSYIEEKTWPSKPLYIYTGFQIIHPRALDDFHEAAFSLRDLYHHAQEAGRLFGLLPDEGLWCDIGTPDALIKARHALSSYHTSIQIGSH